MIGAKSFFCRRELLIILTHSLDAVNYFIGFAFIRFSHTHNLVVLLEITKTKTKKKKLILTMKNLFVYFSLLWANLYNLLTKKPSSYLKMEPLRACVVVVVWVILRSGDPSRCQASSRPSFGFASGKGLPQLTYLSPIQSQSLSTQRCCWGCWSCGYRCVAVVVVVQFFFFLTFF